MLVDFRLKVFMAAAREGSFTRAAKSLGISQPAVSQNIAELEKETRAVLFERNRGSVRLTPAGFLFKDYAEQILRWYSAAGAMFGPSGRLTGKPPVKIAADCFCAETILPEALARLFVSGEGLSFSIVPGDAADADIRLRATPSTSELSVEDGSTLVGRVDAAAVASREYSLTGNLRGLPSGVSLAVWKPYRRLLPGDIASRVVFEAPSPASVVGIVRRSPAVVGLLPRVAALGGGLSFLPVSLAGLSFDLHLSAPENFDDAHLLDSLRASLRFLLEPSV